MNMIPILAQDEARQTVSPALQKELDRFKSPVLTKAMELARAKNYAQAEALLRAEAADGGWEVTNLLANCVLKQGRKLEGQALVWKTGLEYQQEFNISKRTDVPDSLAG